MYKFPAIALAICVLSSPALADSGSFLSTMQSAISTTNSTINTANSGAALVKRVSDTVAPAAPKAAVKTADVSPAATGTSPTAKATTGEQAAKSDTVEIDPATGAPITDAGKLAWLKANPLPEGGCAQYLTEDAEKQTLADRPKPAPGPKFKAAARTWEKTPGAICYNRARGGYNTGVTTAENTTK